jgi:ADP-heptose:LPS heptosyltransferase
MEIPVRDVKKISVLRANAVGDYIVALPALEALRCRYRDAEIVLLGRHWHSDFLEGRPGPVDRTVVVPYTTGIYEPPDAGSARPEALQRFFDAMSQECFDLAFQLHGGGKNSNGFVRNLGARITIGAGTPDAPLLDRTVPYDANRNEMLRLLEIVSLAGANPVCVEPRLTLTGDDLRESDEVVPGDGRPVAVINPGGRDPRRRWPARKFASVADALAEKGARIIINGDGGDLPAVDETLYWMRRPGKSACGILSLRGLAGLLARARLIVSNDSGPLHLAGALGTPVVGIYWFGNMLTYGPTRSRDTALHVSWRLHCPVCGAHCMERDCMHRDSFVSDVTVEAVTASAAALYQRAVTES